jgi:hypothetical protein
MGAMPPDPIRGSGPSERRTDRARARLAIVALLFGLIVSGAASASGAVAAASEELDVVLDSSQHWVGMNDVLFSVMDASGERLAERGTPVQVVFTSPSGASIVALPAVERFATYARRLYRARVPLSELGRWQVQVTAGEAGQATTGKTVLDVSPDDGTPALGSPVPGGATPTMRDAHSMLHEISSDPEPLTAFYTWSLDEALREHQPTVLVLDSYAYRPNAACGGALGILHDVFIDYPGLVIIHAEPWLMAADEEGMLGLDPPGGPAVLTDVARRWGVSAPPWVFVIDRDGRLHAKFNGVVGSDELRAALTSVTAWRPAA